MSLSFFKDDNDVEQISGMSYEFPYTFHKRDLSEYSVPWHWHEELEFNYVKEGTIVIETANDLFRVNEGEGYFINTNVMNIKRNGDKTRKAVEHAHLFHPVLLTGHYKSVFKTKYLDPILTNQSIEVLIFHKGQSQTKTFMSLLHALEEQKEDSEFEIRHQLSEAWLTVMDLVREYQEEKRLTPASSRERASSMLTFIHENYSQKLSLAAIAEHSQLSTRETSRLFKEMFHQTPMDYLLAYRIEQAKHLLRQTDVPVTSVAFMVGFNDSAYFSKVFKRMVQLTPKEYRKQKEH